MNERIKELHNKVVSESENMRWNIEDSERLTKLIVRECVDIIQLESHNAIRNNTYMGDDVPASVTQVAIKKHFGLTQ
jgi:hypothetical protein